MQRRLAIALVLTALVSILLVGVGMLAIAQSGARNRAEGEVTRALSVVGDLLGSNDRQLRRFEDLGPANRRNLQLDQLNGVAIGADGTVDLIRPSRGPAGGATPVIDRTLSPDELARLEAGDTVLISERRAVIGLRLVPAVDLSDDGARLGLLARQGVTAVPGQTVAWFLLSSVVVLIGALIAGVLLARRLVRPIGQIQGATAAIAAGQLTTRVEADGDDELAELARSVNRMAADLERSKALDQQFLLSVSHDLRTPLTAISGYAEALRDGAVPDTSGAGEVIGNHAERLDRLVGDLLDLAKLDANRFRLDLRTIDMGVVTGRTVAGLIADAASQGVTIDQRLDPSESAMVLADADRMAQVIGNLLDNAISFARERVEVTLVVEPPAIDRRVVLTVADDGPGFAPEDLPFIFDRLYTGRDRPRRAENPTGLGLAIVRDLAGAMGGTVAAAGNEAGGASILLTFPVAGPGAGDDADGGDDTLRMEVPSPRPPAPDSPPAGPPGWPEPRPSA